MNKRDIPTLNPRFILFDDYMKSISKQSKTQVVATSRHKGFELMLKEFPEVLSSGILKKIYDNYYLDLCFNTDEGRYIFRNFIFCYHKLAYYEEEIARMKRNLKRAINKLSNHQTQYGIRAITDYTQQHCNNQQFEQEIIKAKNFNRKTGKTATTRNI